jgi:hypothetical protein
MEMNAALAWNGYVADEAEPPEGALEANREPRR